MWRNFKCFPWFLILWVSNELLEDDSYRWWWGWWNGWAVLSTSLPLLLYALEELPVFSSYGRGAGYWSAPWGDTTSLSIMVSSQDHYINQMLWDYWSVALEYSRNSTRMLNHCNTWVYFKNINQIQPKEYKKNSNTTNRVFECKHS